MNINGAFNVEHYNAAYPHNIDRHYWYRARQYIVADAIRHIYTVDSVLDMGCGPGYMVKYLRDIGINCRGFDLGKAEPVVSAASYCLYGKTLADLPEEWRVSTNCLLLLDVIEHLENPVKMLSSLDSSLPRLSHLIVTVPAGPELWSNYDDFFGHHRRYTANILYRELTKSGWDIIILKPIFAPLYLPARLLSALGIKRRIHIQAPGLLRPMHWIIAKVLINTAGWGPGTSLLAVASKAKVKGHSGSNE